MISTEGCGRGPEVGREPALTLKRQRGHGTLEQPALGGADGTGLGLGSTSVVRFVLFSRP